MHPYAGDLAAEGATIIVAEPGPCSIGYAELRQDYNYAIRSRIYRITPRLWHCGGPDSGDLTCAVAGQPFFRVQITRGRMPGIRRFS